MCRYRNMDQDKNTLSIRTITQPDSPAMTLNNKNRMPLINKYGLYTGAEKR